MLFLIYRLLFREKNARLTRLRAATAWQAETRLQRISEIMVPFLICSAVLLFVQHMTPRNWVAGAANAHNYLITQPYVALLYFKTFFCPSSLSADYDLSPFTTTDDPRFWAGFAFVILLIMAAIVAAIFKKTRMIGFGLLWFLIALLSTSALPLAEVMNDHRTFLPYIGLVVAMAGAGSLLIGCRESSLVPGKTTSSPTEPRSTIRPPGKDRGLLCRGADSLRKWLRHISAQQSLEHRRDALAGRDDQKSAQPARLDELRQHAHGERRF